MPARAEPTVAQKRFAEGIVLGKTKTDAYALAHPNIKSKRKTVRDNAYDAAKSPAVQAEIKRLWQSPIVLEQFPDAANPHALRMHAVATMARLTQSSDQIIAMRAADWLREYADKLESFATAPNELIKDLRGLYQKALKAAPLIETVVETTSEIEPTDP